jgi:hypothetical protein
MIEQDTISVLTTPPFFSSNDEMEKNDKSKKEGHH